MSTLLAVEQAWAPAPGATVTRDGTDGTWIVQDWEDYDTVWVHRPDARMFPTIGRSSAGLVDLSGWREEPEDSELVAVADLRPVETARGAA
ncbi:hypothetical protein ACFWYW_19735 [Nonomuraea sp. NPDC059023]|uniref:hypothetical protein n=1 Tax=unclassified Nonomuraea TaxID=2593643 RepID=UPI00368EA882